MKIFDKEFIIQIIKNDSPDNSNLSIFLELFYKWIQPKEKNQAKSTGVSMETAFKKFLYRKNKNKYIINPTYGKKDAIQAEILEDWEYANGDEKQLQVTPYGGGHIRNGIRLWEYVLGRGNSYLDLSDDYTWVENTIEFPSKEEVKFYAIDIEYMLSFENFNRGDLSDELKFSEEGRDKANYFFRYMLFYLYTTILDIEKNPTLRTDQKASFKTKLYSIYENLFVKSINNQRAYDGDSIPLYNLHINYTDAGDKPSSAVSKLYEIMKLRDDVYDRSSRYPVENKSISNIVDKATSTVGPEVSIKIFGDERRPINNVDPSLEINYDEQLSKKFIVSQIINDNLDGGVSCNLTITQNLQQSSYTPSINFLKKFKELYSGILNDIRVLYQPYIVNGPSLINKQITTKDLVKLKFFHLMNFLVYCQLNTEYKEQIIALEKSLISISGGESNDYIDSDCGKKVTDKIKHW